MKKCISGLTHTSLRPSLSAPPQPPLDPSLSLPPQPPPKIHTQTRTHTHTHTHTHPRTHTHILTYNIQIKNNSLFYLISEKKIAKNRKCSWVILFHCVCFELSTVPKRETIQGSRSWKSFPVFSRCLVWFPRKNRKKSQVFMSHSITFHFVYFELSTVPKRETIQGSRSRKSSPFVSRCLIWFPSKKSQKIAILVEIAKNRKKSIRSIAIFSQMKKSI